MKKHAIKFYTHRTLEEALRNKYNNDMNDIDFYNLYYKYINDDIVLSEKYDAVITKNGTFYGNVLCEKSYNPYEYIFCDEYYKDFIEFAGYECVIDKPFNSIIEIPNYKLYGLYYKDDIYYSYIRDCYQEMENKTKKLK